MSQHLRTALLFLITFSIALPACKKKTIDEPTPPDPFDIYAAGREGYVAKYWKNGKAVNLGRAGVSSDANAMVIAGNDVHIAGYEVNASGKYVAKYWKNGVSTPLTDGSRDAFIKRWLRV
mgnify:FL=1